MSEYKQSIPYIITFTVGVFTGGLVSYIGHILSVRRDRRKEFNDAAAEFKTAFVDEIKGLKHYHKDTVWNIIRPEIMIKHEIAKDKFRFFLAADKRVSFDMAWQSYFKYEPHQNYDQNEPGYISEEWDIEKEKKMVLNSIKTLLSYADYK